MDILIIGRWVFLFIGAIALIVAIILTIVKSYPFRRLFLIWVFGLLIAGLGAFGLEFMPKYREWLDTVTNVIKSPSKKSYEAFFAKVGQEEIPTNLQELGINYAINNPVEDMEEILTTAINKAPANSNGKRALEWAKTSYLQKQGVIDELIKSNPSVDTAKEFDPGTSKMFYYRLKELPPSEVRSYGFDQSWVIEYKPTPRPFPGKKPKKTSAEKIKVKRD